MYLIFVFKIDTEDPPKVRRDSNSDRGHDDRVSDVSVSSREAVASESCWPVQGQAAN